MREILGKTDGLKNTVLAALEQLYDLQIPDWQVLTEEGLTQMASITAAINREVNIYVDRHGKVVSVAVGDNGSVTLPDVETRRGRNRLCGIRCIHTHPGGDERLSGVDLSALRNNRYDLMAAIGVQDSDPARSKLDFAIITGRDKKDDFEVQEYGPITAADLEDLFFPNLVKTSEKLLSEGDETEKNTEERKERAILIGMEYGKPGRTLWTSEDSLEELRQLAKTAGADVIGVFNQKRPKPDPGFFIGRGKVRELALFAQQEDIDMAVFDEELSPAQERNLERALGIKVLDRTALILDIFAQRARTNEGKLQVELAQLQYSLPRIMGQGLTLSRLGGGIGTRGPGETKLETDRRVIRDRIAYIKGCIDKVANVRQLHRSNRSRNRVPTISLVGYTNAGKSTLLNTLTKADVYAQDQLFATLDPTTRQLELPDKREAILTDTVGFIQRLPHQLVAAFKSTLEEALEADLLLHVVDVSHPLYKEQSAAVYQVLEEIGVKDKPILTVYNKIDKLPEDSALPAQLAGEPDSVCISARQGRGLDRLLDLIMEHLRMKSIEVTLVIPYAESAKAARLHTLGTVLSEDYGAEGTEVTVRLDVEEAARWQAYLKK
jgi:GTP-binding protein HflX